MTAAKKIAVFAPSPAKYRYLSEIVQFAGHSCLGEKTQDSDLSVTYSEGPAKHMVIKNDDKDRDGQQIVPLPVKASHLIDIINKLSKDEIVVQSVISLEVGKLDVRENLWFSAAAVPTRLTEKETSILVHLHAAGGKAVPKEDLLSKVWSYVPEVETHTLETHIYRLRQKIEEDPSNPKIVLTQEDGYILCE